MEYQVYGVGGGGVSFSNSSSSTTSSIDPNAIHTNNNDSSSSIATHQNHNHQNHNDHNNNDNANNNDDPMHSWWESMSKARARIHSLLSILFPNYTQKKNSISSLDIDGDEYNNEIWLLMSNLSALADSDRPARSLLESFDAYTAIAASLSLPLSGSGDDNLCQWLYDTFQSSDSDLRLVVLSFVPLVAGLYLSRIHSSSTTEIDASTPSLAGFEAVLLALYASETRARSGKPVLISIPDLCQPSLYHRPNPSSNISKTHRTITSKSTTLTTMNINPSPLVGVVSPPLEPQLAIKSTKRGCIVGVAFDSYYKHISLMPSWSKIELCRFTAAWAGADCSCANSLDNPQPSRHDYYNDYYPENDDSVPCLDTNDVVSVQNNAVDHMSRLQIQENQIDSYAKGGARIPLPWELLQPVLRILGHCLLGPLNSQDIRDAAGVAVRRVYARASHDLFPQAILATRSLIQLDNRARATAEAAAIANASSAANTPSSKAKKPEVLLVSK